MTNPSGFAPSPGQLNKIAAGRLRNSDPKRPLGAEEAWDSLVKILKEGVRHRVSKVYETLPELTKKAIGDKQNLLVLSEMDEYSVRREKDKFVERYNQLLDEHDKRYLDPKYVKHLTETGKKMLT